MKIAVLMSTYNGEKYIRPQIESILRQVNVEVTLYIRDDGSSDSTCDIIRAYQREHKNIILYCEKNIGVGNSFMQLLYLINDEYDYYGFCDQDDIWDENKLCVAINTIKSFTVPTLYVSNQILVDKAGNIIKKRYDEAPDISYLQILSQNKVSGCTMVWNHSLNSILCLPQHRPSEKLLENRIHDVWVAMIASTVGNLIYDNNGYIYYRQHENNVVGAQNDTKLTIFKNQFNKLVGRAPRNGRSSLAQELVEKFPNLPPKYSLLFASANPHTIKNKWILIKNREQFLKHTGEHSFNFILKVMFGFF